MIVRIPVQDVADAALRLLIDDVTLIKAQTITAHVRLRRD